MHATIFNQGNAKNESNDGIANFITLDMLNEELAVIEHYLQTTPNTPFTTSRILRLSQEKNELLKMISDIANNENNSVNNSTPRDSSDNTPSQSQGLFFPTGLSDGNSAPISGTNTPDIFSGQKENPFASVVEESLFDEDDRAARELADWEFAQQIAQELSDFNADDEDEELARQRRAQIEADEEFARQIQAAMSPIQQSSVSHHQNFTQMDEDEKQDIFSSDVNISPTMNPMDMFQHNDVYYPQEPKMQSSVLNNSGFSAQFCPRCGQGRDEDNTACWRCFEPFPTRVPSQTHSLYPTLTPLQIQHQAYLQQQRQAQLRVQQAAQQEAVHRQRQYLQKVQQRQQQILQRQAMQQSPLSQPTYPHQLASQLEMPAQPLNATRSLPWVTQPQIQQQQQQSGYSMSSGFSGTGTSLSPIKVGDSPPQSRFPQTNSLFSNINPPPSIPIVNNGWPTSYLNPNGSQANDPLAYLRHIHHQRDSSYANPTTDEIKDLLANIRPDEEFKVEDKDAIIPGLAKHMRLMKHQQMGLAWMQKMESGKNKGGLLADEMGLGKTIQSIALLVSRPSKDENCKTTLICTPVALLRQWYTEIRTKTDPQLDVYIHHSSTRGKRVKTSADLLKYDVVLTTYNTIAYEWKARDRWEHAEEHSQEKPPEKPASLFLDTKWYRIILDESQVIKNRNTQTARGAFILQSTYRWSLSGTPMQNGMEEMYSQLAFLRIRPYSEWKLFQTTFVLAFKKGAGKEAMRKFQALLKAILLRRTKTSKIDGVEILKGLPGKTIEIVHAVFDEEQNEFYQALETGAITQMRKYQAEGSLGRNMTNALVLLLRLRQACLHPRLIKEIKKAGSMELTPEQQINLAKEFNEQTVLRIKAIDSFECPICLEMVLNPSLVLPCGHHYCTECLGSLFDQEREDAIARGEDARDKAKCPECRGDMDSRRLVSLETFKAAHCQPEDDADSYDGSASEAEEDDEWLFAEDRKRKGKGRESAKTSRKKQKALIKEEPEDWVSSAKITKLCDILESIRTNNPTEKVIVFSQFTGFFDLIQPALVERNFQFGRYDGGMTARKREEELENFRSDPSKTVCLVSLRAGAYGLNLTCASQCIILDPFWNPFIEAQAIDRVHRIGQSKPVKVHRIMIEATVEDRILELQKNKRDIIEGALAEDASKAIARLSERDLLFLFGIGR